MYVTSFKEMRLADPRDTATFQKQLSSIKKRHLHTNLLVAGFRKYAQQEQLREDQINQWLDTFFKLRVSTNILIAQYLEINSLAICWLWDAAGRLVAEGLKLKVGAGVACLLG